MQRLKALLHSFGLHRYVDEFFDFHDMLCCILFNPPSQNCCFLEKLFSIQLDKKYLTIPTIKRALNKIGFDLALTAQEMDVIVVKYANTFSKEIYETKVNFSNIWCNINYYKDYNLLHDHNDEMISGVYYTQTPKDCGNIFFFNPAWQINRYPKLNNYSAQSWWLPSKEGTLYLFPSWLLHNVEPNLNKKKKRISFSFNLI